MIIVIDLPEEVTEWFKERAFIPIKYYTEVEEAMEKAEPLSEILDKISAEIKEKAFTEEIFDEETFKSTYTENVTRETAEEESVIETEIVKLSDILEIIEKYKGVSE